MNNMLCYEEKLWNACEYDWPQMKDIRILYEGSQWWENRYKNQQQLRWNVRDENKTTKTIKNTHKNITLERREREEKKTKIKRQRNNWFSFDLCVSNFYVRIFALVRVLIILYLVLYYVAGKWRTTKQMVIKNKSNKKPIRNENRKKNHRKYNKIHMLQLV